MSLHSLLGWEPGNLGAGLTATAGLCRTGSKNLARTKPFITAFSSKEISRRFQLKILRKEVLVLWGFPSRKMHLLASHYNLLEKLLLIAWKCIVQNWIKDSRPNVILCYRDHFNTKKRPVSIFRHVLNLMIITWAVCIKWRPSICVLIGNQVEKIKVEYRFLRITLIWSHSWAAILDLYTENHRLQEVLRLHTRMCLSGQSPDNGFYRYSSLGRQEEEQAKGTNPPLQQCESLCNPKILPCLLESLMRSQGRCSGCVMLYLCVYAYSKDLFLHPGGQRMELFLQQQLILWKLSSLTGGLICCTGAV